jgi:ribonuclease P protein component
MLPRANRLTASEGFRQTIRSGRRAGSPTLVVHWRPAQDRCVKVGFVVNRAVGNSVVRHRVTRRLRHLMRDRLSGLPPAGTLVVRALPGAATARSADLAADLARCVNRVVAVEPA